ncbi:Ltp family lipoprotein [Bifidobacterium sp. M0109]|nr:Ltp family lipoprotein [Bifidobacterium apousia]
MANFQTDYNANTQTRAKSYQKKIDMNPEAIRTQLTNELKQFPDDEVDNAMQHLNQ